MGDDKSNKAIWVRVKIKPRSSCTGAMCVTDALLHICLLHIETKIFFFFGGGGLIWYYSAGKIFPEKVNPDFFKRKMLFDQMTYPRRNKFF